MITRSIKGMTIHTVMTTRMNMTIGMGMTIRTDMATIIQRITDTKSRLIRSGQTTKPSTAFGFTRGGTHKIDAPLAVVGQLR